jgi:hypothetical protein
MWPKVGLQREQFGTHAFRRLHFPERVSHAFLLLNRF